MKKMMLSMVACAALITNVAAADQEFNVGLGYTAVQALSNTPASNPAWDSGSAIVLTGGMNLEDFGVEAEYTTTLDGSTQAGNTNDLTFDTMAVYATKAFEVASETSVKIRLGLGQVSYATNNTSVTLDATATYGLQAMYNINDELDAYVDYTSFLEAKGPIGTDKVGVSNLTIGVHYAF